MPRVLTIPVQRPEWSISQSEELYRVPYWGEGYFFINASGHVAVRTGRGSSGSIDVVSVVEEARRRGVDFPLLIRFQDVLCAQVERLNRAFETAIEAVGYDGVYQGVYPMKVNQLHEVVEAILYSGRKYGMGLECGSKAELVAALPHLQDDQRLLICNGVKDQTMIGLMVSAQRLGKNVIPVVEKLKEFEDLKSFAWGKGFIPMIGARVRLATQGSGRWADCCGLRSKFGLSVPELVELVDELEAIGNLDRLQLLHCHPGSQVADIRTLKRAIREVAQVYASLIKRGVGLRYLDVGGGLGVNYDEDGCDNDGGVNYSMQEYANAIVETVKEVCDGQGVRLPVLITESGRAITAHHSILIVPVLGSQERNELSSKMDLPHDAHEACRSLYQLVERSVDIRSSDRAIEIFHEASEKYDETSTLFTMGNLSLEEHAFADRAYWTVCRLLLSRLEDVAPRPPELGELEGLLADQFLCDFSVFQSMLDHWAIGQPFPIMPIDRLDERPSRRGVLVDLTCDSDGRVSHYVSSCANKSFLPVHPFQPSNPTFMGFFLMGAYEDIMGDAHNLFGRVSEVHVYADEEEEDEFRFEKIIPGTSVQEMLAQVQYFPNDLHRRMSELVRAKIQAGVVRPKIGMAILEQYMACLQQSTYCDPGTLGQDLGS